MYRRLEMYFTKIVWDACAILFLKRDYLTANFSALQKPVWFDWDRLQPEIGARYQPRPTASITSWDVAGVHRHAKRKCERGGRDSIEPPTKSY